MIIFSALLGNAIAQAAPTVSPALPVIPSHTFSVTDFGAVADDATDNTVAFTKAIAAVKNAGAAT